MTKKIILTLPPHLVKATPVEVQRLFIDYGHDWVMHKKIFMIRKNKKYLYEYISPNEHRMVLKFIFMEFHQRVIFISDKRIVSEGKKNNFACSLSSIWDLKEIEPGLTEVQSTYTLEVPWFLGFMKGWVCLLLSNLRKESWIMDEKILERRSELMKFGFDEKGQYPKNRWLDKALPSPFPSGMK